MPNERITDMPTATTPLAGTELIPLIQGGVNVKTEVSNVGGGSGGLIVNTTPITGSGILYGAGGTLHADSNTTLDGSGNLTVNAIKNTSLALSMNGLTFADASGNILEDTSTTDGGGNLTANSYTVNTFSNQGAMLWDNNQVISEDAAVLTDGAGNVTVASLNTVDTQGNGLNTNYSTHVYQLTASSPTAIFTGRVTALSSLLGQVAGGTLFYKVLSSDANNYQLVSGQCSYVAFNTNGTAGHGSQLTENASNRATLLSSGSGTLSIVWSIGVNVGANTFTISCSVTPSLSTTIWLQATILQN